MVTLALISLENLCLILIILLAISFLTMCLVVLIDFLRGRVARRRRLVRAQLLPKVKNFLATDNNEPFLTAIKDYTPRELAQFSFELLYQTHHVDHYKLLKLFAQTLVYKEYIKKLSRFRKDIRIYAAYMLSMFPNEEVIAALYKAISDSYQTVRVIAATSYIRINKQADVLEVLAILKARGISQRGLAEFYCGLPKRETSKLLAMVKDHASGLIANPELIKDLDNLGKNYLIPIFTLLSENVNPEINKAGKDIVAQLSEKYGVATVLNMLASSHWSFNINQPYTYPIINIEHIATKPFLEEPALLASVYR